MRGRRARDGVTRRLCDGLVAHLHRVLVDERGSG